MDRNWWPANRTACGQRQALGLEHDRCRSRLSAILIASDNSPYRNQNEPRLQFRATGAIDASSRTCSKVKCCSFGGGGFRRFRSVREALVPRRRRLVVVILRGHRCEAIPQEMCRAVT
jgi:hypothetical protein